MTILDDSLAEGDETFTLTLSNPVNGVLTASNHAIGTIQDDEVSPCGTPSYNAGVTAAVFLWKNCSTGQWSARVASGGSATTISYVGSVQADAPFASVSPFSIESFDTFDTSNPSVISFTLKVNLSAQDGFNFTLPERRLGLLLALGAGRCPGSAGRIQDAGADAVPAGHARSLLSHARSPGFSAA